MHWFMSTGAADSVFSAYRAKTVKPSLGKHNASMPYRIREISSHVRLMIHSSPGLLGAGQRRRAPMELAFRLGRSCVVSCGHIATLS